jgi:hypothetical protein
VNALDSQIATLTAQREALLVETVAAQEIIDKLLYEETVVEEPTVEETVV